MPNVLWKIVQTVSMEAARDTIGYKKPEKGKSWIKAQLMKLIKKRRATTYEDQTKYEILKAEVQKKLHQDKQKQWDELCNELEAANRRGSTRKLFHIGKAITRKCKPNLNCIKSKNSENVITIEKIAEQWKQYCQELFEEKDGTTNGRFQFNEQEPSPLKLEVKRAIKDTAN